MLRSRTAAQEQKLGYGDDAAKPIGFYGERPRCAAAAFLEMINSRVKHKMIGSMGV
jgi:hypothetical protein